jgi:hypothetical protein
MEVLAVGRFGMERVMVNVPLGLMSLEQQDTLTSIQTVS